MYSIFIHLVNNKILPESVWIQVSVCVFIYDGKAMENISDKTCFLCQNVSVFIIDHSFMHICSIYYRDWLRSWKRLRFGSETFGGSVDRLLVAYFKLVIAYFASKWKKIPNQSRFDHTYNHKPYINAVE